MPERSSLRITVEYALLAQPQPGSWTSLLLFYFSPFYQRFYLLVRSALCEEYMYMRVYGTTLPRVYGTISANYP